MLFVSHVTKPRQQRKRTYRAFYKQVHVSSLRAFEGAQSSIYILSRRGACRYLEPWPRLSSVHLSRNRMRPQGGRCTYVVHVRHRKDRGAIGPRCCHSLSAKSRTTFPVYVLRPGGSRTTRVFLSPVSIPISDGRHR